MLGIPTKTRLESRIRRFKPPSTYDGYVSGPLFNLISTTHFTLRDVLDVQAHFVSCDGEADNGSEIKMTFVLSEKISLTAGAAGVTSAKKMADIYNRVYSHSPGSILSMQYNNVCIRLLSHPSVYCVACCVLHDYQPSTSNHPQPTTTSSVMLLAAHTNPNT